MPIFIGFLSYSIVKFHLFNLTLIGRNVLVCALWILIASLVAITDIHTSRIVIAITFVISLIFGIILIRSNRREIKHLAQISTLANDLQSANSTLSDKVAEQTKEISRAYELEKKARRELEKLNETKDQFIMITQHNIRTPVTTIGRELDSLLANTAENTNPATLTSLENARHSAHTLKKVVDDFLAITTLKAGSQILNLSVGNMKSILEDVLKEFKIDIENMNLSVAYPEDTAHWPDLKFDAHKMREVILILIENAIRYNIKNGSIIVKTKTIANTFQMTIENSGVGITRDEKENIFERLFYRSARAQAANPRGMGIGLSVSRAIIRAHHGDLNIYSEGENKGAMVTVTLPFDFMRDLEEELQN